MAASEPNEPTVRVSNTLSAEAQAQAGALPSPGDVLSGHRIVEKLTTGGFGTVFLADNLSLPGQRTVVKCMPLGQLIEREADVLQQIDHPTVVKVLAVGRTDSFQYIAMEYLKGETLDALLSKHHQLGPIQAVRIGLRIADALEAVHEKGLVHRDLKPANIMLKLAKDHGKFVDWLKLIDFGLARDHGQQTTIAEGTPEYVAPETLQQQPVTPSSDLYALGVILHEMLTGQRPYQASSVNVMVSQHVNAAVPHVRDLTPDVSVELDALVFALMSKEPSHRPATASEVAKRLARLERELSDGSTGVGFVAPYRASATPAPQEESAEVVPLVLPAPAPLAPTNRAVAAPTPLLLPLRPQGKRRWPWVVGAVAVLLVLWLLFGVFAGRPLKAVVPEAVAPTMPVVAVKPAPVVAEPPAPEPIEELASLKAPAVPKSKPKQVKKRTYLQITEEVCSPDRNWRNILEKTLKELGTLSADDRAKYAIWRAEETTLSVGISKATTTNDCVEAQQSLDALQSKLGF